MTEAFHLIRVSFCRRQAFGYEGLGLLTVSGVPGLAEYRAALLPLARRFALLPDEVTARS